MTAPKSAASLAEMYVYNHQQRTEGRLVKEACFLAGHAAGIAEAGELVKQVEDVANRIGMDALQTEYEPGWMDPAQAVKTIEMTQRLQRTWFTELKDALTRFKALAGVGG